MSKDQDILKSDGDFFSISLFDNGRDSDNISLTKGEIQAIQNEFNFYENFQAVVIEALKLVQKRRGWVSDEDVISIARVLGISVSDVEGVATFYSQIFRQPVGRNIIRFCDSVVCYITGCQNIQLTCKKCLNIKQGETTQDNRFTFLPVSCLGRCDQSPVIMINEDTYVRVSPEHIQKILEKYL